MILNRQLVKTNAYFHQNETVAYDSLFANTLTILNNSILQHFEECAGEPKAANDLRMYGQRVHDLSLVKNISVKRGLPRIISSWSDAVFLSRNDGQRVR